MGADAFQIYRGLDLLTAKPAASLTGRVPHHLIGEVDPARAFDVAQYLELATARIAEIRSSGKPIIVCGGTGLYIRALIRGLSELPSADEELRATLNQVPLPELQERLRRLDPVAAASIDLQNPRRVIRAVEVCELTGQPFSSFRQEWQTPPSGVCGVFFTRDREDLNNRIDSRTLAMFADGVIEEVSTAEPLGSTACQAIGYREIVEMLAGRLKRKEAVAAIQQATRHYAKRQLTWFRREPSLEAINLSEAGDISLLCDRLSKAAAAR